MPSLKVFIPKYNASGEDNTDLQTSIANILNLNYHCNSITSEGKNHYHEITTKGAELYHVDYLIIEGMRDYPFSPATFKAFENFLNDTVKPDIESEHPIILTFNAYDQMVKIR